LQGRESEIEEDAIERDDVRLPRDCGEAGEVAVDQSEAVADTRFGPKRLPAGDCLLVGVEREDDAVGGAGSQDGAGVTAAAEGTVEVATAGTWIERGDGFGEKDGEVGRTLPPGPAPNLGSGERFLSISVTAGRRDRSSLSPLPRKGEGLRVRAVDHSNVARRWAISAPSFSIRAD
jgi:hypothetical protein